MRTAAKIWLAFCLLGLFTSACGQAEPDTAQSWLKQAASHYQGHPYQTKFEMEFALEENNYLVKVEHQGKLQHLDPLHLKLDATTVMVIQTIGNQRTAIHNLQVADGEWLWMQSSVDGLPQPIVLKRSLDATDSLAQVDQTEGNQLGPRDLNPMLMWDLAISHGSFELLPEQPAEQVLLQAPVTQAFRVAAAHLNDFFQPHRLQVILDRRTGAPVSLQLLKESGEVSWKNTFFLWETVDLQPGDFQYSPPEGVEILLQ